MAYLTEELLGIYLNRIFPDGDWVHDKSFITRSRPDYRSDLYKLIVEFDGPQHYTSASRIIQDEARDKLYLENGYKTIRFPMYIQMSTYVIKTLFGKDYEFDQVYPHGFISDEKSLVLPCDFCELGIKRFEESLEIFPAIVDDIIKSLRTKIEKKGGNPLLVLPPSLLYLLN